jgi:hypothetical protein
MSGDHFFLRGAEAAIAGLISAAAAPLLSSR